MASIAYKKAYSEVLDILNHTKKEDVEKIPLEFINFLKENVATNYVPRLDHTMEIKDMHLKPETKAILAIIYRKFWCTPEELKEFDEKFNEKDLQYEQYKQEFAIKNELDSIFDKKTENQVENETNYKEEVKSLIKHKESFWSRMIRKFKALLGK